MADKDVQQDIEELNAQDSEIRIDEYEAVRDHRSSKKNNQDIRSLL